jgi:hypothetical protein
MQFTGISTLAFSDVPPAQMSYANTLFSTATQLSVGLGITLGAIGIRLGEKISQWFDVTSIPGMPIKISFVMITLICLLGLVDLLRLPQNAGSSVSKKQ